MNPIRYTLKELKEKTVPIGREGENEYTVVTIDCAEVYAEHPDAVASMKVQNPNKTIYPAAIERSGDDIIWTVKASDLTVKGDGRFQLTFTEGTVIHKTVIGRTLILKSLLEEGPVPEPVADWIDEATELMEDMEEKRDSGYFKGDPGDPGAPGHSPVLTADKVGKTTTIYSDGTQLAQILDGQDGQAGAIIDDTAPAADKTYSSVKVEAELQPVKNAIDDIDVVLNGDKDVELTKIYHTTKSTTISPSEDANKLTVNIPSGTKYYVKLDDPDEVIDGVYYLYVNGNWAKNIDPGVKQEMTAGADISYLSIYVAGSKMLDSGTLTMTVSYVNENAPSLIGTVNKLDSAYRPWFSAFTETPLRIAYSSIWVDYINTSAHWLFASDMGFNVLKGDVEITSDGKLIMCHDPGFTFDGNGRITTYDSSNKTLIVNMTYSECREKFYANDTARFGGYLPVADIDDFMYICKEKGKVAFITIRATNTAAVVEELAKKIISYGMENRTIINALDVTHLQTARANHKLDNVAINYICPTNTAITQNDVDACAELGRCFLSVWCNDTTSTVDSSASAIAYAKQHDVPVLGGTITSVSMWNYLLTHGVDGSQISKPIFDVEPKSYRFRVSVAEGIASFGNLFSSDRFTGDVLLTGTTLKVSNIKVNGSPLTNIIDGIQPIKMNLLNPTYKCVDSGWNSIPAVWASNAFVLTLSNTNDNTYTIVVEV